MYFLLFNPWWFSFYRNRLLKALSLQSRLEYHTMMNHYVKISCNEKKSGFIVLYWRQSHSGRSLCWFGAIMSMNFPTFIILIHIASKSNKLFVPNWLFNLWAIENHVIKVEEEFQLLSFGPTNWAVCIFPWIHLGQCLKRMAGNSWRGMEMLTRVCEFRGKIGDWLKFVR